MSDKKAKINNKTLHKLDNRLRPIISVAVLVILFVTIIVLLLPRAESSSGQDQTTSAAVSETVQGGSQDESEQTPGGTDVAESGKESTETLAGESNQQSDGASQEDTQAESASGTSFDLGRGLMITKIGSYTGMYMEDGSNEILSGILMIMVENTGEEYIQYAEIALSSASGAANFSLSTLFPGQSVVVLEKDRQNYDSDVKYSGAAANNVAVFSSVPSLCEDKLQIQALDGVINVTNISGGDIGGDIVIYYKNSSNGVLYGGITYRIRITGGLKSGEIRQIVADHFSASGSTIMFVTCE